jgi:uncharacterized protein involved in exopolysaccharide biosynthesis
MSIKFHSAAQGASTQEEIVLAPREDEAFFVEETDGRDRRERAVEWLRLLWANRGFLLRVAAAGFLAATLIAFLIPKSYQSVTQLMPPDSESDSGSGLAMLASMASQSGGIGAMGADLLGIKSTGALFIGVLQSRTIQDRIVNRFDLKNVYGAQLEDQARQSLSARTAIGEDRKSGIITLMVTDHDPKRAAAISSAYVDELDTLMAQLTTSSAHRERVFLEERLSTVKQDLEFAEKDFSQFASKNGTIDITEQGKAMVESEAALEGQLIAAQSELEGLKQIYTDNNVRVRSIQARIDELRSQLQKLGGKAGDAGPGDRGAGSDAPYPTLRQLPILGVPYADKFRQLQVEQAVYETLTKEYELAKVQEAKEIPTVRVLDPPEIPEHKSSPPRLLIMFLGTMCPVLAGCIWILGVARWQEVDSQDAGKLFAQEVFGTLRARLPVISRNGTRVNTASRDTSEQRGDGDAQRTT